jgi:chemotaxis signal transduction protein
MCQQLQFICFILTRYFLSFVSHSIGTYCPWEVGFVVENLERYSSNSIERIQALGKTLCSAVQKFTNSVWNNRELLKGIVPI